MTPAISLDPTSRSRASRWRPWVPALWFAALLLLCYAVVLARLGRQWFTDPDMSHGPLVPLFVGYLVWQRREALLSAPSKPTWWGLPLLVLGAILLWVGPPSLTTFASITRLAFLCSLVGMILCLRGAPSMRLLAYPFVILLLMIPIPGFLYERVTVPLQFVASAIAERALDLLGYSVLREGNILHLPGRTLSVTEACSGIRSLLTLTFVSQAYVYLFDRKVWMRAAVVVVIVPIAVLANSSRIVFTGMVGQGSPELAEGIYHDWAGWALFVVAFGCLVFVHWTINAVSRRMAARTAVNV